MLVVLCVIVVLGFSVAPASAHTLSRYDAKYAVQDKLEGRYGFSGWGFSGHCYRRLSAHKVSCSWRWLERDGYYTDTWEGRARVYSPRRGVYFVRIRITRYG